MCGHASSGCSFDGELNNVIAECLALTNATVDKWRSRFIECRIAGLYDEVRPCKPSMIVDEGVTVDQSTLQTKPTNGSKHWSVCTELRGASNKVSRGVRPNGNSAVRQ